MDGISAVTSSDLMSTAAGAASSIAAAMLTSTENLESDEVDRLFSSLGLGSGISAMA